MRPFHFVNTVGVLWMNSVFLSVMMLTFGFWPWHSNSSEQRTKHVFYVNLAQIHSPAPAIHCRIQVPRIERVSPISPIWCINPSLQTPELVDQSSPNFLYNVDRTSTLLTRPSTFPYCYPLWNASPKKEGMLPISRLKLVAITTSLDRSGNQSTGQNIYTNMSTTPENLVKIGPVVSEISLL